MAVVTSILDLAKALLGDYAKLAIPAVLLPASPEILAAQLTKLVLGEVLKFGNVDITNITDDVLKEVKKQISELQNSLGIPANGVLGTNTLDALKNRCLRGIGVPIATVSPNAPANAGAPDFSGLHDFRYFLDGKWPEIDGVEVETLFENAWNSWQLVANIRCDTADTPEGANVLITSVSIDGAGNVLADATVGQGRGSFFPMTMRVDNNEQWTAKKFQGVITHEIGHLLGLHHSAVNGQLMDPFYQAGIIEPKPEDIQRIQDIWGQPKGVIPPGEIIDLPPGF